MMNIKTRQLRNSQELPTVFDAIICSSGYESRSTFLFERISKQLHFQNLICLSFSDNCNSIKLNNDKFFINNGFKLVNADGNTSDKIRNEFTSIFDSLLFSRDTLNILVDYSCMTRIWYAEILQFFKTHFEQATVNLFFSYSYSKYVKPNEKPIYNSHVDPITGFSHLSIPERPTALLVGLGYEKNRAFGLREYLDAQEVYLFIAERGEDDPFKKTVLTSNNELITQTDQDNIFFYPLFDMKYTENILFNLCEKLIGKYRIVFAPCGPKPFTLLNFIVSLQLPDIDVWRISAGNEAPPIDKKASGDLILFQVSLNEKSSIR